MKQPSGEDRVLMSFTDVLTCVFGAAILLFLIFAILVVFAPLGTERIGLESGPTDRELRSIQDELLSGFATSTLRVLTPSDALLGAIEFEGPREVGAPTVQVDVQGQTYQGYQLEYTEVLGRTSIRLPSDPEPDWDIIGETELVVSLAVGGLVTCLRIPITRAAWEELRSAPLAEIGPETLGFLRSRIGGSPCDGA